MINLHESIGPIPVSAIELTMIVLQGQVVFHILFKWTQNP